MRHIWILWMGLMLAGCLNLRAQQIITLGRNSDFRMVKVTGHVQLEESETKRMVPLPNASVRIYNLTDSVCQTSRVTDTVRGGRRWFVLMDDTAQSAQALAVLLPDLARGGCVFRQTTETMLAP